jgi:Plant transposon protein
MIVTSVEGMIGSLAGMHIAWKNCPMAWQGEFSGKEGYPTIILEALADNNLFIWHGFLDGQVHAMI